MSGRPAESVETATSAVIVVSEGPTDAAVFDVIELVDDCLRVRTPLLFEIGETLHLRIQHAGRQFDADARVRAHTGPVDEPITEIEIVARSP